MIKDGFKLEHGLLRISFFLRLVTDFLFIMTNLLANRFEPQLEDHRETKKKMQLQISQRITYFLSSSKRKQRNTLNSSRLQS